MKVWILRTRFWRKQELFALVEKEKKKLQFTEFLFKKRQFLSSVQLYVAAACFSTV